MSQNVVGVVADLVEERVLVRIDVDAGQTPEAARLLADVDDRDVGEPRHGEAEELADDLRRVEGGGHRGRGLGEELELLAVALRGAARLELPLEQLRPLERLRALVGQSQEHPALVGREPPWAREAKGEKAER